MLRALNRDPDQRVPTARQLERELHALIADESPEELAEALAGLIRDNVPAVPLERSLSTTITGKAVSGAVSTTGITRNAVVASPPLEPKDDFFGDLPAAPAPAVVDWGPPAARYAGTNALGTPMHMEASGLVQQLLAGDLVGGSAGIVGKTPVPALELSRRMLLGGLSTWPVAVGVPVGVAPVADLAAWVDAQTGWLTLFTPAGKPLLGAWVNKGAVMLVLDAAESGAHPLTALLAALNPQPTQLEALVDTCLAQKNTARLALQGVGLSDARQRQVLDTLAAARLRAICVGHVPYALAPMEPVHDVPPPTVSFSSAVGLRGPNDAQF